MSMHKALHPRDDIDRLYFSRKEGEKGLARILDSLDTSSSGRIDTAIWMHNLDANKTGEEKA